MVNDRRIAPRRRLDLGRPLNLANAAIAIQAAARGFLARRRAQRRRNREHVLLSPMDIQRKYRRARKPAKSTPKVFPKARIGSRIGTVKSKRPVSLKGLDPLLIKTHLDQNSKVSQSTVSYFGYADAGDFEQQRLEACKALVNMFFRRSGIKMTNIDQTSSTTQGFPGDNPPGNYYTLKLRRIIITFLHHDRDGAQAFSDGEIAVNNTSTIHSIAVVLSNLIKLKARTAGGSSSNNVMWPIVATLWSNQGATQSPSVDNWVKFAHYDLTNTMIDFSFKRKYKWQNITPAGTTGTDGGTNINDIQANPLSGRVYKFKGPVPLVRDPVKLALTSINGNPANGADFANIEDQGPGHLICTAFRKGSDYTKDPLPVFAQPFKANQYFKNCETEDKVYMPPGGYKELMRSGKVTMNFKRFMQATTRDPAWDQHGVNADPTILKPPKIGTSTLWALEPALRTDVAEEVRLHVNYETWFTTKARVSNKKQPVVTEMVVQAGPEFGTS